MRRLLVACVITLASAAPAVAADAVQPPRASLESFVCERAPNPLDRVIGVTAVMRPVPGTQRMQMRLVLQRRAAASTVWTRVQGGDLGRWLEPTPDTLGQQLSDVWRLKKLVANLPGPATYRFRVSFRWTGTSAVVLSRTSLGSEACSEPK